MSFEEYIRVAQERERDTNEAAERAARLHDAWLTADADFQKLAKASAQDRFLLQELRDAGVSV